MPQSKFDKDLERKRKYERLCQAEYEEVAKEEMERLTGVKELCR